MEQDRNISVMSNIIFTLKRVYNAKKIIFIYYILQILATCMLDYIWIFASAKIINNIQFPNQFAINNILKIIVIAFFIELASLSIKEFSEKNIDLNTISIRFGFILDNMKKSFTTDYKTIEEPNFLDLRRKSFKAIENPEDGISGVIKKIGCFLSFLFISLVAIILLIKKSILISSIITVLAFVRFIAWNYVAKFEKQEVYDNLVKINRKSYYFDSIIRQNEYAKDIRLFSMKNFLLNKQKEIHESIVNKNFMVLEKWKKVWLIDSVITIIQQSCIYIWLILLFLTNKIEISTFVLYSTTAFNFINCLNNFLNEYIKLITDARYISDYRKFINYSGEKKVSNNKSTNLLEKQLISSDKKFWERSNLQNGYVIEFKEVYFRYPHQKKNILKKINIKIESGKRTAIVGHNGAGKSTLIKLICRLYEPTEGTILLNGINILEFEKKYYYNFIAPVFQDIQCFAMNIGENISFCENGKFDEIRINECMEKVGIKNKIDTFSNGIETQLLKNINESGIDLSGGEKQKLAFARAIYKNSPIIMLDEPTSALDPMSEEKLYQDLDRNFGEKTVIYISHRLSSTRFCHNIFVIEEGEVVEMGTHEELMKLEQKYAKLYKLQAKYYNEEA